ncbi:MAG: hypothetical protein AAB733_01530 [Patescibacteria group bacterium]
MEIKLFHHRINIASIPFSVWAMGILLAGSLALFLGVLIPTMTNLQSVPEQLQDNQRRQTQLLRQITDGAQSARLLQNKGDWDDVTDMFVQESQALEFIVNIEQLAKDHNLNLSLDLAQLDEEIKSATPKERIMTLTAHGEWEQLLEFLNALTHLTPVMIFQTLTFTNSSGSLAILPPSSRSFPASTQTIALQLTGMTYWILP